MSESTSNEKEGDHCDLPDGNKSKDNPRSPPSTEDRWFQLAGWGDPVVPPPDKEES